MLWVFDSFITLCDSVYLDQFTTSLVRKHVFIYINQVQINKSCKHDILGQLGISAYTFDDSNRAFASVRVGLRRIRPIFRQEDDGTIRKTEATMVEEDVGTSNEPLKLKFILYKYVFENWEDETKVNPRRVFKENFARQLQNMFDALRKYFFLYKFLFQTLIYY